MIDEIQIAAICAKISDEESEKMLGGIETVGHYGFKCAQSGFKAAINLLVEELNKACE